MFLKIRYIIILLCILEFYFGLNQITEDLKTWKLDERWAIDSKNKKDIFKNDKNVRVNLIKQKEKKDRRSNPKWPKLMRQGRERDTDRFTKMDMMQENEETIQNAQPLDDVITKPHILSSYSMKQQLVQLASNIPDSNATLEIIGRTIEYQDIVMLRITESKDATKYFRADDHKYAEESPEKKIIFIVHGLSVLGIDNLPSLIKSDSFKILLSYYTSHLDKFDIFLIPIANPDGFAYVMSKTNPYSSIWNKNVSPQSDCPGVALDRNFDVAWVTNRTISSCSQQYPGSSPFSEAESTAVRNIFHKYAHKIVAYFNVHAASYHSSIFRGDAVLYPKGYSDAADADDKYIDLKGEIDEAIRNASFQVYSVAVDSLYNWYGKVHGTSVDYASTVYGIPYAMELVMQSYEDHDVSTDFTHLSLTEVWQRVIDVIINYIHKSLHGNDVR